ncbi:MAG: hypothetical protein ACO1SV_23365 [Fimbriimonas sp.]
MRRILVQRRITFVVDATSQATNLKQLSGGKNVAGWNQLTGPTTLDGEASEVKVLSNVAYRNGNGPFFGFITLERADDSILTMRMDGFARKDAESGVTAFEANLEVLGGTGVYNDATGAGAFTGSRSAALGNSVHLEIRTHLD